VRATQVRRGLSPQDRRGLENYDRPFHGLDRQQEALAEFELLANFVERPITTGFRSSFKEPARSIFETLNLLIVGKSPERSDRGRSPSACVCRVLSLPAKVPSPDAAQGGGRNSSQPAGA
jgi:hypothetical protein